MPNIKIIKEIRKSLKRRGHITRAQREYAQVEEMAMVEQYPFTKPVDDVRYSHLRTLKSYIGEKAVT